MALETEIIAYINNFGLPAVIIYLIFRLERAFNSLKGVVEDFRVTEKVNSKMLEALYKEIRGNKK